MEPVVYYLETSQDVSLERLARRQDAGPRDLVPVTVTAWPEAAARVASGSIGCKWPSPPAKVKSSRTRSTSESSLGEIHLPLSGAPLTIRADVRARDGARGAPPCSTAILPARIRWS